MNTPNEFEQLLEKVAPDIYLLHRLSVNDPHIWRAIYGIMDMIKERDRGRLVIHFTAGKIQHVEQVKSLTAYTGLKPIDENS